MSRRTWLAALTLLGSCTRAVAPADEVQSTTVLHREVEAEDPGHPRPLDGLARGLSADRLRRHVEVLSSACMPNWSDPWGECTPPRGVPPLSRWAKVAAPRLRATTDYLRAAFFHANGQDARGAPLDASAPTGRLKVFEQEFSRPDLGIPAQRNVIAVLPGSDCAAGAVVVGAHHDSINNRDTDDLSAPGANDNGTGTGALLELARVMAHSTPRRTVYFVAFAAEEFGRLGSRAYVEQLPLACDTACTQTAFPCRSAIKAMVNLDILGNPVLGPASEPYLRVFGHSGAEANVETPEPGDTGDQQLARFVGLQAASQFQLLEGLSVVQEPYQDRPGRFSDHLSFTEAGIPAVRFIAAHEGDLQHSARDRVRDRTTGAELIDWSYVLRATRLTLATVWGLADGLSAPEHLRLSEHDTLAWDPVEGAQEYQVLFRAPGAYEANLRVRTSNAEVAIPEGMRAAAVSAVDAQGLAGSLSSEAYLTECVGPLPGQPVSRAFGGCDHEHERL